MDFEYTVRATPQHNHMAELGFATLGNKGRALMVKANVPVKYRYHLFREAFSTTTDLDGLVVMNTCLVRTLICLVRTLIGMNI
jgi:hypothetical protein